MRAWRLLGMTGRKAVGLGLALLAVNLLLWGVTLAMWRAAPLLLGTALLAYGFGLRHAVDADHVAAIDNVTRKLMRQGQRPVAVGLHFSLGHSSVVFALSAAVAVSAAALTTRFPQLRGWGGLVGGTVSALFLLLLGAMNAAILVALIGAWRRLRAGGAVGEDRLEALLARRGLLGRIFGRLFGLVGHSWQMFPIGLLFGLGFDTATEVALLGISAAAAGKGLAIWTIMLFPALFAAGMALLDTADSLLMLGAYGWAAARPGRRLGYNIVVTSLSVAVALGVGGVEALGLLRDAPLFTGPLWQSVARLGDGPGFGRLGYGIVALFALSWAGAAAAQKWRRRRAAAG